MVYTRRFRRARPRRARRGRKVVGTTRSIAVRALKTARYVRKVAKPETLYKDFTFDRNSSIVPYFYLLNPLSQGDTQGTRTADAVRCLSLSYSCYMLTPTAITCRIMVFIEKTPIAVGTAPAINTIVGGSARPFDLRVPEYTNRYKVLMDKTVSGDSARITNRLLKGRIKLDCLSKWTDGTDVNIEKNAVWVLFMTDTTSGRLYANFRLHYSDV